MQAVAAFFDLGWHTVKSIDKMRLQASVVEPDWSAIDNTSKVIKRRAYGYRDEEYFYLKIRAAFPGILR